MRACERRVTEAARKAGDALIKNITEQQLRKQLLEAKALQAEIGAAAPGQLFRDDIGTVQRRIDVYPRIQAGEFNDRSPLVWVETLRSLGRDLPLSPGGSLKIEWPLKAIQAAQSSAAALVSVPGWYPLWVGFPVPE
jgi:hypothetical protein